MKVTLFLGITTALGSKLVKRNRQDYSARPKTVTAQLAKPTQLASTLHATKHQLDLSTLDSNVSTKKQEDVLLAALQLIEIKTSPTKTDSKKAVVDFENAPKFPELDQPTTQRDAFWSRFETKVRNGTDWSTAMYGDIRAYSSPQVGPTFLALMSRVEQNLRAGMNLMTATSQSFLRFPTSPTMQQRIDRLEVQIRSGMDWKVALEDIKGIDKSKAYIFLMDQISRQIRDGNPWWIAAAKVFLDYPPIGPFGIAQV